MRKILIGLLVADMVATVFASPMGGLETRNPFGARPLGYAMLGVLGIGMALVIAAMVHLARDNPRGSLEAAIGAALFLPTAIVVQPGMFHPLPPPAISAAE